MPTSNEGTFTLTLTENPLTDWQQIPATTLTVKYKNGEIESIESSTEYVSYTDKKITVKNRPAVKLTFNKKDFGTKALSGATIQVTGNSNVTKIEGLIDDETLTSSGSNGNFGTITVYPSDTSGEFKLNIKETNAPDGYKAIPDTVLTVKYNIDTGVVTSISSNTNSYLANSGNTITVKNQPILNNLKIVKTDAWQTGNDGNPLRIPGVTFTIELTGVESVKDYDNVPNPENKIIITDVKTDSNGEINLKDLVLAKNATQITAKIIEIEVPDKEAFNALNGYYYILDNSKSINMTMTYDNGSWSGKVDRTDGDFISCEEQNLSGRDVSITIKNQPYIDLAGKVWNDGQTGEKTAAPANGLQDPGEKNLSGVQIGLYSVKDNKIISTKYTDENGKYSFRYDIDGNGNVINSDKIKKTPEGYIIIFSYDGINWEPTIKNAVKETDNLVGDINGDGKINNHDLVALQKYITNWGWVGVSNSAQAEMNADINSDGKINQKDLGLLQQYLNDWEIENWNRSVNSKAAENEETRHTFNNRFKTISKDMATSTDGETTTSLEYTYNTNKKASTLNTTIDGHTPETQDKKFQISAEAGTETEPYTSSNYDINCGLVKRTFDLAAGTDLKEVVLKINEKETKYTYAQIMNGELDDLELDKILQNNSSEVPDEKVKYNLAIYTSDYNYRIDDYETGITNTVNNTGYNYNKDHTLKRLKGYAVYTIILENQTKKEGIVEEFVYYYDQNAFTGELLETDTIYNGYQLMGYNDGRLIFKSVDADSNKLSEANDYRKEINLRFEIETDPNDNLIVDRSATNIVEITKYSTTEGGLIDKDSAPDNAVVSWDNGLIDEDGDAFVKSENGTPKLQEKENEYGYEDDTDQAKGLDIVLRDEERIITGTVFDDTNKDGILNDATKVNDVIVQLIEIKRPDINDDGKENDPYCEYIWQETRSGSNIVKRLSKDGNTIENITYRGVAPNDGTYVFTDFIPGNYIIRYIYGDGRIYNITGDVRKYNGQDYKSTIDPKYKEDFYNTAGYSEGQSIARDNEARRLDVMAYSVTIDKQKGEKLDNKTNDALQATWMCAETSTINIPVDADDKVTEIDETVASYWYTKNEQRVEFVKMNFGLALRPKTNIVLEKHITALKVTPIGTGVQSIVDAKAKSIEEIVNGTTVEVQGIQQGLQTNKSTRTNRGFWLVATDVSELMQGADLEVEYTYVARNDSEEDYLNNNVIIEYLNNVGKDGNANGKDDYEEYLQGASNSVVVRIRNGTYSYSSNNQIGSYLGRYYYTGNVGENDALVMSRVEILEEALNNDLIFESEEGAYFDVYKLYSSRKVFDTSGREKTERINTVVRNTSVCNFLTPKLEGNHTTETADWNKKIKLRTTLSTITEGEEGANIPSYIAEIVQYSNAAGRKDMNAIPGNLNSRGYSHSDDTTMTMENSNEHDESWAESIIIGPPTGEDKITPIQIVIITTAAIATLGVGIILIKKFVLKK